MSATFSVKAIALAKSSNLKTLSNRLIPSFSTSDHRETLGLSSAISASVSVGSPPRQGTHFARTSSSYNGTETRQRTVIQVSSVRNHPTTVLILVEDSLIFFCVE